MSPSTILKHRREFAQAIERGDIEITESGIVFPKQQVHAAGMYFHSVNGEDERSDPNLIPDAGILHILSVVFGSTPKASAWYLALFSGAITPASNWTAANFASTASEITSGTEGYSNATRPQFVAGTAASNSIDNLALKASYTIVCTTSINVNGAAMLSDNAKGGTSGVLGSASRFSATRTLFNGDTFELGYKVSMTG